MSPRDRTVYVMERSKLSLKWLEVFQAVARRGSVRDGAADLGVSVSTASHHLACLETVVGAALLDHGKRPMQLTAEGERLLRRVDEAMWLLRTGLSEIWSEDLGAMDRLLRIAHIEDFDTDVGPELADHLSRALPACEFSILSRPSHEILDLLQGEQADIGIATSSETDMPGLTEDAVLRDPYLMILPNDADVPVETAELDRLGAALPFLRYSKNQLIGRRVEAQLRRSGVRLPGRMEFESTHAILSMVAAGRGWTITTAMNYARARRYHGDIRIAEVPGKVFARQISVYHRDDLPAGLNGLILDLTRRSMQRLIIDPTVDRHPWLSGQFHLLPDAARGARPTDPEVNRGSGKPA